MKTCEVTQNIATFRYLVLIFCYFTHYLHPQSLKIIGPFEDISRRRSNFPREDRRDMTDHILPCWCRQDMLTWWQLICSGLLNVAGAALVNVRWINVESLVVTEYVICTRASAVNPNKNNVNCGHHYRLSLLIKLIIFHHCYRSSRHVCMLKAQEVWCGGDIIKTRTPDPVLPLMRIKAYQLKTNIIFLLSDRVTRAWEIIPEVEGTRPLGPSRKRVPECLKGPKTTYKIIAIAEK